MARLLVKRSNNGLLPGCRSIWHREAWRKLSLNSANSGEEPLANRLRQWLGDALMDIHILRLREHSVADYSHRPC